MRKILSIATIAALVSTGFAYAAGHVDAVTMRKNGMQVVGASMGTLAGMAKGQIAFDAKHAASALKGMNYVANTLGNYFPEDSSNGDTTASPKIWEDMAGFKAALAKLDKDTAAALANPPQDQASLGAMLGTIGGNCKSCHETYRVKK